MLAVFAVVLAFAGAPASIPVTCHPSMLNLGETHFDAQGNPDRIDLDGGTACLAAVYASATEKQRLRLMRANPKVDWANVVGVGLLAILHEAEHAALRSLDECRVQKAAMAALPSLLRRLVPQDVAFALSVATGADRDFRYFHGCG